MAKALEACLLVTDITGYTVYLNASELEHAQGTLTDLLNVLVDHAGPPLRISKLEGDAVFSYALGDAFTDGRLFLDLVEDTYVAFRRAIDSMVLNNTCQCNACANVSSLDLKFIVHFGSFISQHIGAYDELLGPDVNLVHRLLKNTVTDQMGMRAYCLYTASARDHLGLDEVTSLIAHDEDVTDFGHVETFVQDLGEVYHPGDEPEITIDDSDLWFSIDADIPMSPAMVWDYLSSPLFRNILLGTERQELTNLADGRVGVGSVYQCYHGDKVTPQRVVRWEPFTTIVTEDGSPDSLKGTTLVVYSLAETPSGTHLEVRAGGFEGRPWWVRTTVKATGFVMRRMLARSLSAFIEAMEADQLSRSSSENGAPGMP